MHNLIRFYNQNRKKIWMVILVIVLVIIVLQLLDMYYKKKEGDAIITNVIASSNYTNQSKEVVSEKSAVTGQKVSKSKLQSETEIIKEFIEACNNQDVNLAYNLLTDECKDAMFKSEQDFINIYYKTVFNGEQKIYTIENWVNDTYKVKISEDLMATGEYDNSNVIQDYITVKENEDDEYKLNINNFIGREEINRTIESNKIKIDVKKVDVYMDYSTYTFDIKNNSYRTVLLDDFVNIDTMYLEDSKGVKYSAYTHEISLENLKLGIEQEKTVDIKYYSKYSSTKKISKIIFSKVITDFERYDNLRYKEQYGDCLKIEIEM